MLLGIDFIATARGMPAECRYLIIRLQLEQQRLMDWAKACGLLDAEIATSSQHVLRMSFEYRSFTLALDLLHQMRSLVEQFRYQHLDCGSASGLVTSREPQSLPHLLRTDDLLDKKNSKKLSKRLEMLRRVFSRLMPAELGSQRLMWAAWNKKRFETMLEHLVLLNNALGRTMSPIKQDEVSKLTQENTRYIVQLIDKVQDLEDLIKAVNINRDPEDNPTFQVMVAPGTCLPDCDVGDPIAKELTELASIKILNRSLELNKGKEWNCNDYHDHRRKAHVLNQDNVQILGALNCVRDEGALARSEAIFKASGGQEKRVWVEWKSYEKLSTTEDGPDELVIECIEKLVILLQEPIKPTGFRVLRCIGYFVDPDFIGESSGLTARGRVGLVFEKPNDAYQEAKPISLLQLLEGSQHIDSWDVEPPLTVRIELALKISNALSCLHSVGWLHKGLRSRDILFFQDKDSHALDLSKPYIMGFSFSRPAARQDMTERPPFNPKDVLYRHPYVSGDSPQKSFQKVYDIYSLGVALIEIALWSSIESLVEFGTDGSILGKNVRRALLQDTTMKRIAARVGLRYQAAVKTCLDGSLEFPRVSPEPHEEMNGLLLSEAFHSSVLKPITGVVC